MKPPDNERKSSKTSNPKVVCSKIDINYKPVIIALKNCICKLNLYSFHLAAILSTTKAYVRFTLYIYFHGKHVSVNQRTFFSDFNQSDLFEI